MDRSKFRRVLARSVVVAGVATLGLGSVVAASATPQKKPSLLQQGLNYYRGKTITLIVPSSVGGGYDLNARIIGPFVASYLGATVNVDNVSFGTTVAGQDEMAAASKNGLTIGMIDATTDATAVDTGAQNVNFNPARIVYLGGSGGAPFQFSCSANSPYQNFGEVVKASSVSEVIQVSGSGYTLDKLLNAAFAINASIVTGYSTTTAQDAGFERGDGQCINQGIASLGSFISAGKAHVLLQTAEYNPATAFANLTTSVPLLSTLEKQFPAKTKPEKLARAALAALTGRTAVGHEFNAPIGTPADEVAALQAAFHNALTTQACENKLLAAGQTVGFIDPSRAHNNYLQLVAALKPVASLLGS